MAVTLVYYTVTLTPTQNTFWNATENNIDDEKYAECIRTSHQYVSPTFRKVFAS
jgi:hypothetical protein